MPELPSFPAPDIEGVLRVVHTVFLELENSAVGKITNITQSVQNIFEMDCGGEWVVYVNTGTKAVGKALWLLVTPSLDEILENYLNPKPGRRKGRRGQRGERTRKPGKGLGARLFWRPPIPDVDEAIAKLIPGGKIVRARPLLPGEWLFWTGIEIADNILLYWLLVEATETFTVTWMSELMKSGKCLANNDGECGFTTHKQSPFTANELWFAKSQLINLYEENVVVLNNGTIELPVSTLEGNVLCFVLAFFDLQTGPGTQVGYYNIGVRGTVRNRWGDLITQEEKWGVITCPSNAQAMQTVDFAIHSDDFHTIHLEFLCTQEQTVNIQLFECWADLSLSVRSVHVG